MNGRTGELVKNKILSQPHNDILLFPKGIVIFAGLIILTSVVNCGNAQVFSNHHIACDIRGNDASFVDESCHSKLDTNNSSDEIFQIAYQFQNSKNPNIKIDLVSPHYIREQTGQYIKVRGIVTNLSPFDSAKGGIAYISIVDTKEKIPVDLEDWSVEKGLYIPNIKPGQTLPIEWDVRLVKAGTYNVDILFNIDGDIVSPPIASSKISLVVDPKVNLNPGNVLPIAFGVSAGLIAILGSVNYLRSKKTNIHK
jgi:hypothetical protein